MDPTRRPCQSLAREKRTVHVQPLGDVLQHFPTVRGASWGRKAPSTVAELRSTDRYRSNPATSIEVGGQALVEENVIFVFWHPGGL